MKARRNWTDNLQVMKHHICHPRLLYYIELSIIFERERKTLHGKTRLKEFMTIKPALQKILERILRSEKKVKHT